MKYGAIHQAGNGAVDGGVGGAVGPRTATRDISINSNFYTTINDYPVVA